MRTRLNSLLAITLMFLKPALRQPIVTLLVSMLPISFIVIFQLLGGESLSRHALFGSLIVFATNVGVISMPQVAVNYKVRSLQDMFVSSPVSPLRYAAALGLSRLGWIAPGLIAILGVLLAMGGLSTRELPGVLLIVLVTWFTGTMIGFTTATVLDSPHRVGVAANLMGMLLCVLPPVYYPLDFVPGVWRWLALILPTTNAAQLVRVAGGVATTDAPMLFLHWSILLGSAVLCALVTLYRANWRES